MKRIFILALGLVLVLGAAVLARAASDSPKQGGTLTLAVSKDLVLLNPLVATKSTDESIRALMFESLLSLDSKGNIQPNLAESWQVSPDGKVYTFGLRRAVKFHNGQEMTAEDAKYAIDYTLEPKNGAYGLSLLGLVQEAETEGKYTLIVRMKKPNPALLAFLTDIKPFSAVPRGSLPEGLGKITTFPPGTGPFKFVSWKPRQEIVLERFGDYWGPKALVDRLKLKPITDAAVRFTALRAGDVDMTERTPYEWVKQIQDGKLAGLSLVPSVHADLRAVLFNVADPPFNNKKLRQAVAHAVNKEEILRAAYFGFGEAVDQKYPRGHAWNFEGLPWPVYNLERARGLLKESGYAGEPIELIAEPGETTETMSSVLQAQLKRIGMNVRLAIMDVSTYNARQRKGEFAFRFRGGDFYPDPWSTYGRDLRCGDLKRRIANNAGYCDSQVESWLDRAETELDPDKRRMLFKQIMTKVAEDIPEIFIGFVPRFFTVHEHVKGFTTDDNGAFRWWGGGLNAAWLDKGRER